MHRFSRFAILLAFGLVTAAHCDASNHGKPANPPSNVHTDQRTGIAASNMALANSPPRPTDLKDYGCGFGQDRRSELCAQWKAADAAQKSADWSVLGFVASVIGAALLVPTLVMTAISTRAATNTATSNRAWILHSNIQEGKLTNGVVDDVRVNNGYIFIAHVKNMGQSPAFIKDMKVEFRRVPYDFSASDYRPLPAFSDSASPTIPPDSVVSIAHFALNDQGRDDFFAKRFKLIYYAEITYYDIYTVIKKKYFRKTIVCLTIEHSGGEVDRGKGVVPNNSFKSETSLDLAT